MTISKAIEVKADKTKFYEIFVENTPVENKFIINYLYFSENDLKISINLHTDFIKSCYFLDYIELIL